MGPTRRLSVISPTTMLFLMSLVSSPSPWPSHTTELLMLMVDSAETHPHLFPLLPLNLPLLLTLLPPTRLDFLLMLPMLPLLLDKPSGRLTCSSNPILSLRRPIMTLLPRLLPVLPLKLLLMVSPKPPTVL